MCDNGKYFFYLMRLITIFLSFTIQFKKSQRANKCSKMTCKNENKKLSCEMVYRYTFDSILQGSSGKHLDFDQQFGFFLFCFKVFYFFSLNWIFSLNSATMESNTSLLNAFLVPLSIKFPWNYSLDQLESRKRNLFHEKFTCEMSTLSPFFSVRFDLIFRLSFIYFQIYWCFLSEIKQQLKVQVMSF